MSEEITDPENVPIVKIADVKPFQNRFKAVFKVIEKSEEKEVQNRQNPEETHRMSDVLVGDDTGSIILTAWDDDINLLEDGKYFSLTNGYVNLFKSSMRLARGKYGIIEEEGAEEFEVNQENNRSEEVHEARRRNRRRNYNPNRQKDNYRF